MAKIVALAGGVGASKFLRGLVQAMPPADLTVVVNTGDDIELHGLVVCPDLDTVVYSLGGASDPARGWGLAGESWRCLDSMRRYGMDTWFQIGDRDLATHLYRTGRIRDGATLAEVTHEIAHAWGVQSTVLPMTEDHVENRVVVRGADGDLDLHFQEYLVKRRGEDPVERVYFKGIKKAKPLRDVVEAIEKADGIVFCPSNPVVSIGPILSLPGIVPAIAHRSCRAVGISPIIQGAPVRGPADRLMPAIGLDVSCVSVAKAYHGLLDCLVIDAADARHRDEINSKYMHCEVAQTLMTSLPASKHLARVVLEILGRGAGSTPGDATGAALHASPDDVPRGGGPAERGPDASPNGGDE